MPNLHFRNAFVHEIFSGEVKGVWEVIYFLVGHQGLIGLILYNWRWPVDSPILIGIGIFEPVLVQETFDEFHRAVLKLIKIPYFIMLGHVAHFRKCIVWFLVLAIGLFFLLLLDALNLLFYFYHIFALKQTFARPRLEPQSFRKLPFLDQLLFSCLWCALSQVGLDGF